jgi:hypothetical protein
MDDANNLQNVWLKDIYQEAENRTGIKCRALDLDFDKFAVSKSEYRVIHEFTKTGINQIITRCSMLQLSEQTPFDGINYIQHYDLDTDSSEAIGRDDFVQDDKMQQKDIQYILFDIDGVDPKQSRYTSMQQEIKDALISYVLMSWWETVGQADFYRLEKQKFENFVSEINLHPVNANKNSSIIRKYRPCW